MKAALNYFMAYAGCVLMAVSIFRYARFSGHVRRYRNWKTERNLLRVPIVLLVLFLAGYVSIAVFGLPTPVVFGILFGGSVFVLVMLSLMQRRADRAGSRSGQSGGLCPGGGGGDPVPGGRTARRGPDHRHDGQRLRGGYPSCGGGGHERAHRQAHRRRGHDADHRRGAGRYVGACASVPG